MKKIQLVSVGELKFKGLKELEKNYLQKINFFASLELRQVRDIKSTEDALKKKKEGQAMLAMLEKNDFVIALDEKGKKMSSVGFARFLEDKISRHPGRLVFLIGGHAGLSPELDPRIHARISFSEMTFAHDLFKILFLEQLYRAFTIMRKIKYHR